MHLYIHTAVGALGAAGPGLVLVAACVWSVAAVAQSTPSVQGIYSCVDSKGRKITADRPIAECMDRTQRQLSGSGTVKREIQPSLTADERAALEARQKVIAEQKAREAEDKRRNRALLVRYPNPAAHDRERVEALGQVQQVINASNKRSQELGAQRKVIDNELEFYKNTPERVPEHLKRRLEENTSSLAEQKRFVAGQDAEKKRVNQRFDEELMRLRPLWGMAAGAPAAAAAATAAGSAATDKK
jgi:hypothetical protein